MSALFLGEIFYLFIENGRWGLIICNVLLLIIMSVSLLAVIKIQKKSLLMKNLIFVCLIFLFCLNTGYHICSSYSVQITGMESQFKDKTKLYIEGKISDVEEKSNSIYCYVKCASVNKDRKSKNTHSVLLIIKRTEAGSKTDRVKKNMEKLLIPGNYIHASAIYSMFDCARNDGGFDERDYYYSIGISGKCTVTDYKVKTGNSLYDRMSKTLYKVRQKMCRRIERLLDSSYAAIYKGILLGEKSAIPEDTKELYKSAGIAHILSISGLHISLIGYFIYRGLRKFRGILFSAVLSVSIIFFYAVLTGGGFSTKRAVLMFGVNILADCFGRTYDLISALSLSFIAIIVTSPFCIFHSGFLLSFGAILGINPLYSTVADYLELKNKWLKSWFAGVCVNAVTRPVIIYTYHEIPLYSSVINIPVILLMGILVSCGFIGIFISYLSFRLGKIIFYPGCRILEFYEFLCRQSFRLPKSVMIVKSPSFMRLNVYYLIIISMILLTVFLKRGKGGRTDDKSKMETEKAENGEESLKRRLISGIRYAAVCMVMLLLFVLITYRGADRLEVKMIDVGQGDSIYVNVKGKHILIDAGSSSERNITRYTILPFLKANGVEQIDYLIMTHSDFDHAGGMAELLNKTYNGKNYVRNLILPDVGDGIRDTLYQEIMQTAAQNKINIIYFSRGSSMKYRGVEIKCIWPYQGADTPDKNNLSIVLKLESKNFTMLFTGDLSKEGEKEILKGQKESEVKLDDVDILKVGHHGSDGSGCIEFISLLAPKVSLISCGLNNTYGHPGKQAVKRLLAVKSTIFITTKAGQINIVAKDRGFYVETFLH